MSNTVENRPTLTRLFLLVVLSISSGAHASWLTESRQIMGTEVSVELWSVDESAGRAAIDEAMVEMQRLDQMMNPWNASSELARINREAANGPVSTTPEIATVVRRALHYSRLSHGAFDISFASVGQYYDYRAAKAPSDAQLRRNLDKVDYRAIALDTEAGTIAFSRPGLQIDLGGIAKGYAVDNAIAILRDAGISSAVVSAGGDTRVLGDLGNRPRNFGIRHPRKRDEYAVMIPLADTAISTSGDYERFFEKDGVRFHHILNPATGRSATEVQSVSILAARAIDSDALSTTVFVLGVERGLALVNRLDGVDAIIIDGSGKLHYSAELLLNTTP